jgi:hypothetical protein
MARWSFWLQQQKHTIVGDNGTSKIVLQGPDDSPWHTWPIAAVTDDAVDGILTGLREELPRGRHACKLLAIGTDGLQMSMFPLTLEGSSQVAADAASQALGYQRANSILIANTERMMRASQDQIESLAAMNSQKDEAHAQLLGMLERVERASMSSLVEAEERRAKTERMDSLFEGIKPLIGVAAELFSSLVADWAMKRQQAEAKAKAKSDSPPIPEPTQAPPQVAPAEPVGVLPDAPTSVEPAQSHLASGDSQPVEPRTDGVRRPARNERSASRATGRKTPKPKR